MPIGKRALAPALLVLLLAWAWPPVPAAAEERPRVVMLGDSLTAGYDWPGAYPGLEVHNLGHSGDTTRAILKRLDEVVALAPDTIFLQAGINDLGRLEKPGDIVARHQEIWTELGRRTPRTRLCVISLLPVDQELHSGRNQAIRSLNHSLGRAAEARGLVFIDLYTPLSDDEGRLRREFTTDGVHLTRPAYEVWRRALEPHVNGVSR